jgi:hypothetical protein
MAKVKTAVQAARRAGKAGGKLARRIAGSKTVKAAKRQGLRAGKQAAALARRVGKGVADEVTGRTKGGRTRTKVAAVVVGAAAVAAAATVALRPAAAKKKR